MKTRQIFTVVAALIAVTITTHAQSFLTNGLVAYYPFNGNANDASGSGNNGTRFGATLTADRYGTPNAAYAFNGTNQYISTPIASTLNGAQTITISMWLNDASAQQTGAILGDWNEGNGGIYLNDFTGSNLAVAITPSGQVTTSTNTVVGAWHHVVVVFDGTQSGNSGKLKLFFDGIGTPLNFNYTIPNVLGGGASAVLIGGRQIFGNPGDFFMGAIDDVRIYNRALSTNEVVQLFALESVPVISIQKAVYLTSSNLRTGSNYVVQASTDLINWTNQGSTFTANTNTWQSTNYWNVPNWNQLFFRVQQQ